MIVFSAENVGILLLSSLLLSLISSILSPTIKQNTGWRQSVGGINWRMAVWRIIQTANFRMYIYIHFGINMNAKKFAVREAVISI